ncbi:hypothetical protein [Candidatus Poriferisodalis sp.]
MPTFLELRTAAIWCYPVEGDARRDNHDNDTDWERDRYLEFT